MSAAAGRIAVGVASPEQMFILSLKGNKADRAMKMLDENKITNPDFVDATGNALIHYAIAAGEPLLVRRLAELGADLNALNADGLTPLHMVVSFKPADEYNQSILLQLLQTLLDKGADPMHPDESGLSPVDLLLSFNDVEAGDEYVGHVQRIFEHYIQMLLEKERARPRRELYPKGNKHKMNGGRQMPSGTKKMRMRQRRRRTNRK